MIKLFVGVALDRSVQHLLARIAQRLRERGLNARFEDPQKYHLTLAFLGWVERSSLDAIVSALRTAAGQARPFYVDLDRIGAFPHERRPRVVWIGSRKAPPEFAALAQDVRFAYSSLGFEFKDDPVAHVTIARVKNARSPLPTISAFSAIRFEVATLALFESLPAGRTTHYEVCTQAGFSAV